MKAAAVDKLNSNKASGLDRITVRELRHFARKAIRRLVQIFTAIIRPRYLPKLWKIATVIILAKPNPPPDEPNSYWPIFPLLVVSKPLEKLLHG